MTAEAGAVELRDITTENFDAVISLAVAEAQRDFLDSNVESIAWAYVAPECHPIVIYADGTPVGFATYGHVAAEGRCWIIHFMVDERSQRRGIGRAALEQLLERMTNESGGVRIGLAVNPENVAAIRLYEQFGFEDTGKRQNGEIVMVRAAIAAP